MPPLFFAFLLEKRAAPFRQVELFSYPARQNLPWTGNFCLVIFSVPRVGQGRFS